LGFWSGGRESAVEQTAQGGTDAAGLMRHRVSGSAAEQPVPRKISDDDDTAAPVLLPMGDDAAAGPGSIANWIVSWLPWELWIGFP
jgi:hypothetical protein